MSATLFSSQIRTLRFHEGGQLSLETRPISSSSFLHSLLDPQDWCQWVPWKYIQTEMLSCKLIFILLTTLNFSKFEYWNERKYVDLENNDLNNLSKVCTLSYSRNPAINASFYSGFPTFPIVLTMIKYEDWQ